MLAFSSSPSRRAALFGLAALLFTPLAVPGGGQSTSDAQAAFASARAQRLPAERVAALEHFLQKYPGSEDRVAAQQALLETCLTSFPDRGEVIHAAAVGQWQAAPPGLERWVEEARLASQLASAGDHGVDLEDADLWASDAVRSMSEPAYRQQVLRMRTRYGLPSLGARQQHTQFLRDRAAALTALANVRLQQNRIPEAESLLAEALRSSPHSSQTLLLHAQLELLRGDQQQALTELVHADALAPLPLPWRDKEVALFASLQHGDAEALQRQTDAAYEAAYPALFRLPSRTLPPGGHPALLQLFTGSDCAPCAGPDLAVDSLLESYTRQDLIVLELDLHVPRPDPLATPGTLEQAALYRVESTPTAFLDGERLQIPGSSREDVQNIVVAFAEQIEEQAQTPAAFHLVLSPEWTASGLLRVGPSVTFAPTPVFPTTDSEASEPPSVLLRRAVLRVALVEDQLRYPGKNGVRFHRMVVRSLQQAPASLFAPGSATARQIFSFELAAIQTHQAAYLANYEAGNDRYGAFQFPQRDFPLRPDHLAFVAWLQDPISRRVLQSTYAALPTP